MLHYSRLEKKQNGGHRNYFVIFPNFIHEQTNKYSATNTKQTSEDWFTNETIVLKLFSLVNKTTKVFGSYCKEAILKPVLVLVYSQ